MREFDWIARYFQPLTLGHTAALNLQDDAALLTVPVDKQLVITTDTLIEGVHFFAHTAPADIAHKALAVNLSDLAAMGAVPYAYSLALSIPTDTTDEWMKAFSDSLGDQQKKYECFLLGGDSTASPAGISITITAYGLVNHGAAFKRSAGKVGDALYVTGTIGDSFLGLHALQHHHDAPELIARYLYPQPRIAIAQQLAENIHACMDVSDGLLQDLGHVCAASNVGATLHLHDVPLSNAARDYIHQHHIPLASLCSGGDDYELLFSAPVHTQIPTIIDGVAITRIGELTAQKNIGVLDKNNQMMVLDQKGYQHF